jgi:hypothetical protein
MLHLLENAIRERLHGQDVVGRRDGVDGAEKLRGSCRLLQRQREAAELQQLPGCGPWGPDQAVLRTRRQALGGLRRGRCQRRRIKSTERAPAVRNTGALLMLRI